MKNNFGGVGKGYEDTVGATAIGAYIRGTHIEGGGEARADDPGAVRCVTNLIDPMIPEAQMLYKGTDMKNRCMLLHDALAHRNEAEAKTYLDVKYPGWAARFIKPVGTTCAGTI
jgi:hypothetical protein